MHDSADGDDNAEKDDDGDSVTVMIAKKTSAEVTEFWIVAGLVPVGVLGNFADHREIRSGR